MPHRDVKRKALNGTAAAPVTLGLKDDKAHVPVVSPVHFPSKTGEHTCWSDDLGGPKICAVDTGYGGPGFDSR